MRNTGGYDDNVTHGDGDAHAFVVATVTFDGIRAAEAEDELGTPVDDTVAFVRVGVEVLGRDGAPRSLMA